MEQQQQHVTFVGQCYYRGMTKMRMVYWDMLEGKGDRKNDGHIIA